MTCICAVSTLLPINIHFPSSIQIRAYTRTLSRIVAQIPDQMSWLGTPRGGHVTYHVTASLAYLLVLHFCVSLNRTVS